MKKIVLFTLLLTLSLLAKDYALIIGISKYKNMRKKLSHIDSDIKIYEKILKDRGVKKTTYLIEKNATYKAITHYLSSISKDIQNHPNSRFFMFFAGHGISANTRDLKYNSNINKYLTNSGVILPYDYNPNNLTKTIIIGKRDLRPYLINIDKNIKESLIVFDACYAGNSIKGKKYKKTPFIYSNPKDYPYHNIIYIASSSPKNKSKSGVLSKVLNSCYSKLKDFDKLKSCMNRKLKYRGQPVSVITP